MADRQPWPGLVCFQPNGWGWPYVHNERGGRFYIGPRIFWRGIIAIRSNELYASSDQFCTAGVDNSDTEQ